MSSTINTITVESGSSVSVVTAGVQGPSGPNTVLGRSVSSSTASTLGSLLVYDHANTEWIDSQSSAAQSITAKLYNLQFTGGGASVTAILDEDNLGSNSNTALATQQSIKAYVDAQISGQDLDFQGDTGGALAIDLASETLSILGGTGLSTVGSGNTVTVNIDSTVVTLSGTQTLTNKTLTSPDINGGDISSDTTINKSPVITLAGALTGTATLTELGNATLTATLASNSVTLGTSTTGNYVAGISAGEGIDVSGSGSETATVTISAEEATDSNKGVASFDATDFTVSSGAVTINAERVQDIVGSMVGSNTESGISVTYEDSDGTLDFNVSDPVITLSGDVAGSATMTNLGDVTITTTIQANSVALGTDTTGNYLATLAASNSGIDVANSGAESAAVTVGLNTEYVQDLVGAMVAGNTESGVAVTYDDTNGKIDFNVSDPVITLSGDVTGSATMTNLGDVTITTTVEANSVALGTDTTGNYIATVAAGEGIDVSGSGSESAAITISAEDATDTNKGIASFDATDFTVSSGDVTINAERVQDLVGLMLTGNTESGIAVTYEDSDGTIDFNVNDPTITLSGDVAGSATMTNLGDVTITTTIQANSITLGTDTAGAYVATVAAGEGIDVSGSGSESATITISAEDATDANKGIASFDASDFTVTSGDVTINAERVQDIVGAMVSGNTESGIAVAYQDGDGTLDFDVSDFTITLGGDLTGSATITNLASATLTATIAANSVALGTDTTGNYVATVADAGNSRITVANSGAESAAITLDIADSAIGTSQIADGAVDADKIANNSVALGTKTTGNYVATIADAGNSAITVANSGSESAAVTLDIAAQGVGTTELEDDSVTNAKIANNAVTLGTQSSGNYVATIAGTANEITVSGSGSETAAVTIGLPDDVTIGGDLTITGDLTVNGDSVELNTSTLNVEDLTIRVGKGATSLAATNGAGIEFGASTSKPTITWDNGNSRLTSNKTFHAASLVGALTGNASTATALETARAIALSGDVVGTANFDGSAGISISTTIQANSVALGTDTTGNYVATVAAGEGIDVSGSGSESAAITISAEDATDSNKGIASFNSTDFSVSSGAVTLANSGVTAGTSGSSTAIPQITVDAKGRITAITTNSVGSVSTSFTLSADSGTDDTFASGQTMTFTGGSGIDTTVSDNTITIAAEDATSSNKGVASFDSTDFSVSSGAVTLQAERIQDIAGAMFSSNTETGITATYQDADGTIDLAIGSGDITNDMLAGSIANSKLSNSAIQIVAGGSGSNVSLGGTITISGTSNEIEVSESGGTVTVGLPSAAQVTTSLGVGGGSTNGVQISQGAIAIKNGGTQSRVDFYCETSNAHYARLQAPAHSAFSGNVTLTLPTSTGNLIGTGDSGTVTNAMLAGSIANDKLANSTVSFGGVSLALGASDATPAFDLSDATNYPTSSLSGTITNAQLAGSIANSKLANSRIEVVAGGSGSNISLGGTLTFSAGEGIDVSESGGTITVAAEDATSSNKGVASFDSTDFSVSSGAVTLQAERIQDIVGAMVSSNTETGLSVAYQDSDGTLDFSLSATGVSAASYGSSTAVPVLTIDANGRVTAASTASISSGGFTLSDGSTTQTVSGGDTLTVAGTSNEIDVAVSATDTLTIGLPNNVTVSNNLTVSGNLVVTGTTTQTGSVVTDNNFTGLTNANTGNSTDFGFYGKYVESSTTKYAGLFYDASTDNTFRLFADTQTAPSTTVNTGATGYAAAGLVVGGLTASSITIGSTAVTATAAELNILDGVNATAAELNIMDGGTSATSTTLADADRVVVNDNGTMKQVALTDFETYFESALDTLSNVTTVGTLGSLGVTGDLTVNTNVLKVDTSNNRVGILDATPSVTLDVGTATDAIHLPVGTTAQRPTGAAGRLRYNSTTGKFEGYTSEWGDIGGSSSSDNALTVNTYTADGSTTAFTLSTTPSSEDNLIVFVEGVYMNPNDFTLNGTTLTLDAAPPSGRKIVVYQVTSVVRGNALNHDQFSCNGSTTAFTLGVDPLSENNTQVFLDGVYQQKTDYSVSGTTLTMDTAPASGATLEVMTFLDTAQAVISDGSITTAKLADDSVTIDKIADQGTDGKVLTSTGSGVAWETPAGGGAWTRISTTDVTSAVATVEITISGSYDYYVIRYSGWNAGTSSTYPTFGMTTVGGSYSETIKYVRSGYGGDTSGGTNTSAQTGTSYASIWPVARTASTNGSAFGELHISNVAGQPSIHGTACLVDDDQSLDLGFTNFAIGFDSPSSNDKIGKVRVRADNAANTQAGKFVLYGIATS